MFSFITQGMIYIEYYKNISDGMKHYILDASPRALCFN